MSDRQKGLVPALKAHVPLSNMRFFLRHIYAYFKLHHRGALLKDCLEMAAKSTTLLEFQNQMSEMRQKSSSAWEYMQSIQKEHWARHTFGTHVKCDRLLNNLSECFNAWKPIASARQLPIYHLLEGIRRALLRRFEVNRSDKNLDGKMLCPRIYHKIEQLKRDCRFCISHYAGAYIFEVEDGHNSSSVDLSKGTCACYKWDLTGIPCKHAMSSIQLIKGKVEDYVHPYYHVETYKKAYAPIIMPVNGPAMWKDGGHPYVLPPRPLNAAGAPKKKKTRSQARIRDPDEPSKDGTLKVRKGDVMKSVRCSKCGEKCHNKTTYRGQKSATRVSTTGKAKVSTLATQKNMSRGNASKAPSRLECTDDTSAQAIGMSTTQKSINACTRDKLPVKRPLTKSMGFLIPDDTCTSKKSHVWGYGIIETEHGTTMGWSLKGTGPQPLGEPTISSKAKISSTSMSTSFQLLPKPNWQMRSSSQATMNFRGRETLTMSSNSTNLIHKK